MQGRVQDQRDFWDVESLVGHLLPAGGVFGFLAEQRLRLFPAEMFDDLFPSGRGRPSIPPDVVAAVIVLQTLHGLSDREAADAVSFDLRWKAACGIAVDAAAFHPTTLTYWRRRLAASGRPHRIFEVVRQLIIQTGAVKGKTRRALDSTIVDDAVARQDTITQLIAAVRRVAREVPDAARVVAARCTGYDYTHPGKPRIAWDDPAARDELVSVLVNDALALLTGLAELDQQGWAETAQQAVALLALVAGQDVEPAEGSDGSDGRWRVARRTAPDRVISTVDPEARHAHKTRERRQDGFKAHLVVEPDTGLITAGALTKASGPDNSDAAVGTRLLATDTTIDLDPEEPTGPDGSDGSAPEGSSAGLEVLGDSAYGSGDALHELHDAGHIPIIKPLPTGTAVEGGFSVDDFIIDDDAGTATCPNQVTRPISSSRKVTFGAACAGCPFRARCTTSRTGRKLTLRPHDALQRAHRVRAATPEFQTVYRRHRPMVERSIAWLVRGNRRVPYRGVDKNHAWLGHRVAAINLRRLLALGLHLDQGTWALAAG